MRQLTPVTNLVLAIAAGVGLLGSLTLSWFAAPVQDPNPDNGPVESAAFQVAQVFATQAKGQVTGTDALGGGQTVLLLLVGVVAVLVLAVLTPQLRQNAEEVLQLVAIAAPIVVIVVAIAHPGVDRPVRMHYGVLVGLAVTLLMSSAAWQGARMRQRRKVPKGAVRISRG